MRSFALWGMLALCVARAACGEAGAEAVGAEAVGAGEEGAGEEGAGRSQRAPSAFTHLQELRRDCFSSAARRSAEECLAKKVVLGLDALAHARSVPLAAGLSLEAGAAAPPPPPPLSPTVLEEALPRAEGGRVAFLYSLIGERLFALARDRSLRWKLADALGEDVAAAAPEEARGLGALRKVRKMLTPFVLGVVLKLLAFLPLLLSSMGVLAIKALGASKLAILITGLIGLRRLLGGSGGDEGATGDAGQLTGGYQLEKSYGLLSPAPAISLDYAPHYAAYAPHSGYYARAAAAAPPAAAAHLDPHYSHTVAAAARHAFAASRVSRNA